MSLRRALVLLSVAPFALAAVPGAIVFAGGSWAAVDRGSSCVALTRSEQIAAKGKVQATAGFAFTPDHRRWGEFHAHLRRMPRAGASVMLDVGGQAFLLVARGDWAWSSGPLQEQAIIAAARDAETDARREPRCCGTAFRRSLFARRCADGDRRGGGALRSPRRWQNPLIAPR